MIKVDNKKVISGLAKRDYRQNIKRNILTIMAILLSTFMITSIFSMGISYWKSMTQRSIMMDGIKYDVILPEPTEKQIEKAHEMDEIAYAGLEVKCAIIKNYGTSSSHIRLYWSDETNWTNQCIPAFEFVEGSYPEQENEVMMSAQTLKELGIENPRTGMTLSVTYYDLSEEGGTHVKTLNLTGYYRDYSGTSKGFVSKSFYDKTGVKQTDLMQGQLYLTLKDPLYTPQDIKVMEEELAMEENQMIYADDDLWSNFLKILLGLSGLALLIITSGYLFIYNVLYISISKEIQFYGQLKTIGATSKQIKRFVYKQVIWNSLIGIPLGMLVGGGVSFVVVPTILNAANPTLGTAQLVVFHPAVFMGAAIFSLFTVFISCRKPAIIAGNISPIEATKYVMVNTRNKYKKRVNGSKLSHMAWRNIFREKKQAVIIFLSFFVALTAFLSINILIYGNSAGILLNTIYDYDMRILNQTITEKSPSSKIDISSIEQIGSMEGVASVQKVITSKVVIPYREESLGNYFKRIFDLRIIPGNYEETLVRYKENPENASFLGNLAAIDAAGFEVLDEELKGSVNREEFMAGKVGIVYGLLGVSVIEAIGKELTYFLPEDDQEHSIKIAAQCIEKHPNYFASGYAPDIIISEQLIGELLEEPVIELLDVDYEEPFNGELDNRIKEIFSGEDKITFDSKLDDYDEMKQSEDQLKVLGGGLGMILALLAILNYCNMITTGIQNRRKEFAALQSIGMTSRQLRKVLIYEGLGYGIISILMVSALGTPISYLVFQFMNRYGVDFHIPILENGIVFGIILLICILIPPVVYHLTQRDSIVEQLNGTV